MSNHTKNILNSIFMYKYKEFKSNGIEMTPYNYDEINKVHTYVLDHLDDKLTPEIVMKECSCPRDFALIILDINGFIV